MRITSVVTGFHRCEQKFRAPVIVDRRCSALDKKDFGSDDGSGNMGRALCAGGEVPDADAPQAAIRQTGLKGAPSGRQGYRSFRRTVT